MLEINKTIPNLAQLLSSYPHLKAIFFDMDGTLFDTEPLHALAIGKILEQNSHPIPLHELEKQVIGLTDEQIHYDLSAQKYLGPEWNLRHFLDIKNQIMLQEIPSLSSQIFPNKLNRLLQEIHSSQLFLGLVTSSEKIIADQMVSYFKVEQYFQLIITREDCHQHKPDPAPYLHAMKRAHVKQKDCLIFEDSKAGLAAAMGSGAHVHKVEWFTR